MLMVYEIFFLNPALVFHVIIVASHSCTFGTLMNNEQLTMEITLACCLFALLPVVPTVQECNVVSCKAIV